MRILVSGRVLATPGESGAAWAAASWVLSARDLGHEADLIEPLTQSLDARQRAWLEVVHRDCGVRPVPLLPDDPVPPAEVLVNLSGCLTPARAAHVPRRVYVDLDPAFTQAWALAGEDVGLDGHTAYATVGLALGRGDCPVPTLDREWHHVFPPVPLSAWPVVDAPSTGAATTVGHWRSYGTAFLDGKPLGQRAHTIRRLLDLPAAAPLVVRPALGISPDEIPDLERLADAGWTWSDPAAVAGDPASYGAFIRSSRVELGFAKAGYVTSRCGWFSDRTAAYLASGRPAVVTTTGLDDALITGEGLLTYGTTEEAVAALQAICDDETRHRRAARAFAEQHLDGRCVVGDLLERAC
jgi:hypothetical protein